MPLSTRPAGVWCVGVLLTLALVFVHTAPRADVALARLLTDGALLALWLISAGGWGALIPVLRRMPGSLGIVTCIAAGQGMMSLAILLLGLAGVMNALTAWGLAGIGAAAALACVFARFRSRQRVGPIDRWHWFWLVATPFLAIALVAALLPPNVMWGDEPNAYDVLEYHLQLPREWYEMGRIAPLEHNVFSHFPLAVEMHYLLAMHLRGGPWAGMYLAQLMHVGFAGLTIAAVYAVVRAHWPVSSAVVAAVAAAIVPWIAVVGSVAYNEGGLLLFGTLAIGWTLVALRTSPLSLQQFAVAGAMAGVACGCKLTAVPLVLMGWPLVVFAILFVMWQISRRLVAALALYVVTGVVIFSPWLIRNTIWTGNPVFPEAQSVFGQGHFNDVQTERWARAHAARADQGSIAAKSRAVWNEILANWRYGWIIVPLGLAAAATAIRQRDVWLLLGMLFVLALFWFLFTHLQGRFFVLAVPLAALLIGQVERSKGVMASLVVIAGAVGLVPLHARLTEVVHDKGALQVLAIEDLSWATPENAASVPDDRHLALIGDAKAFLYQRPMSRLSYRTVFDIKGDPDDNPRDVWLDGVPADAAILIDPSELQRFNRTYQPITRPPETWLGQHAPFLLDTPVSERSEDPDPSAIER